MAGDMIDHALMLLRQRTVPLELVIFDCDGVLIDSEALCNRIVADELTRIGWPVSAAECERRFIGMSFYAMRPLIEAQLGHPLDPGWLDRLVGRIAQTMAMEVEPVAGAPEALHAVTALGLPWRIASNSSHLEMAAKFGRTGLADLVAGRTHSATDAIALGGRGKPAPDVYLAAAAAEGVPPAACLVIEDTATGVTAAVAAGMTCLGYVPTGDGADLRHAGAIPFHDMRALPRLVRAARDAVA
jgi:beta-phosphoglucomutase-like phosphatase (HAD superfamily)